MTKMRPIDPGFKELARVDFGKSQPEYAPLVARVDGHGGVYTCWQATWLERLSMLFSGRLYITTLTFHKALQPMRVEIKRPEIPDAE
jgi:hypothetical protein